MSDTETITCPSGLSGTIRGLKVREEKILADRRLARGGQQINALLAACWQETLDNGPYAFEGLSPDWDRVLQGDRFFILLKVRALTYGADYAFSVECSNPVCGRRIQWSLSLDDLPVRPLAPSGHAAVANGTPLETILPGCGKRVRFMLGTGLHERKLATMREGQGERMISAMLAQRIVDVEGLPAQAVRGFVEDLSLRDANYLMTHFESVECGVQTGIEVECLHCLRVQELELPLDAGFLWPARAKEAPSRSAIQRS